jgi:multiple RNA-binding domain-containing protein 1
LSYTCTEEDLYSFFGKYGEITEILYPLDKSSKKPKGYCFVLYLIPENAKTALEDLDKKIFQGRILHIIPARSKIEKELELTESNYKKNQSILKKKNSGSSENWNPLFMRVF